MLTLTVLCLAALSIHAWGVAHHGTRTVAGVALQQLGGARLPLALFVALGWAYLGSRPKRAFRWLLVAIGALAAALAGSSHRLDLALLAAAACAATLALGGVWPEIGDRRRTSAGWMLLAGAVGAVAWLTTVAHPSHRLVWLLIALGAPLAAAGIAGLALLDRNPALPSSRDLTPALDAYRRWAGSALGPFALMRDKAHFWAGDRRSFLAFGCRAETAVALGAAIGEPGSTELVYAEFRAECRRRGWRPALYQVSRDTADRAGWGHRLLIGSEAIVPLPEFGLGGPEMARLRHDVNRGRRRGVTVELLRDVDLDADAAREVRGLASTAAGGRLLGEMSFSVGRQHDPPLRRTLGLARDAEGRLVAYATWFLVEPARLAVLDELRRLPDAPDGAVDLLMYTCLCELKEVAESASLGMAPVTSANQAPWLAGLEELARYALQIAGPSPGLYLFKAKFNPRWEPRYVVADRRLDWPAVALALFLLHFPGLGGVRLGGGWLAARR